MKKIYSLLSIFMLFLLTACENIRIGGGTSGGHEPTRPEHTGGANPEMKKNGPPAHAAAHGYRKKFDYCYYPSKKVYYCAQRKLYFWISGDGWKLGTSLPADLSIAGEPQVTVDIPEETPYLHYESNYKEKTHPGKGNSKGKGKGKGK